MLQLIPRFLNIAPNDPIPILPTFNPPAPPLPPALPAPPAQRRESMFDILLKLDCFFTPGITVSEFRRLLGKCRCGLVMTRRSFKYHTCAHVQVHRRVVDLTHSSVDIDLTANDSDDSQ
jgi:hypothetical protein